MADKYVRIRDTGGIQINPAKEETLTTTNSTLTDMSEVLTALKQIRKLLEPLANVDTSMRQRVAVDSSVSLTVGSHAVTLASTVISSITTFPYGQQWEMIDRARTAYAVGIRNNISF